MKYLCISVLLSRKKPEYQTNTSLHMLLYRLTRSSVHRTSNRHIGDSLNTSLKAQESYSNRLLLYLDKVENSPSEADQVRSLEIKDSPNLSEQAVDRFRAEANTHTQPLDTIKTPAKHGIVSKCHFHGSRERIGCRPGCGCSCHLNRKFKSPWLLNAFMGEFSIHWYSQKKPEVRCNCSEHTGVAVFYRFPDYILQRYISMIVESTYLDGPELLLRVPRILPWTHLLWRYSIYGDLKAVQKMFADRVASPHDIDPAGRNALVHASKHRSPELAIFLLDQGADVSQADSLGGTASERFLKRAFGGMYSDSDAIIRRILKGDDSFDDFGFTTLHKIVLGFDIRELQVVLDATTDTLNVADSLGRTCLFWAVFRDNVEHVQSLLFYGADPNVRDLRGFSALDFVRGPDVCKLLLVHGAQMNINPRNYHRSSVHEHVLENGCPDVIDVFASAGFDIDIRDIDDETPLLNAIHRGQTTVVKRLLELGANVNGVNKSSRDSAIHFAAHCDRPDILEVLLAHGADYTVLECYGRNLAHCAAKTGSTQFLRVMIARKLKDLDINLKDHEGKTPGEYMESRIVMTDREVGVHEAWDEFVKSLDPPQLRAKETEDESARTTAFDLRENEQCETRWKIPGAFPNTTCSTPLDSGQSPN